MQGSAVERRFVDSWLHWVNLVGLGCLLQCAMRGLRVVAVGSVIYVCANTIHK